MILVSDYQKGVVTRRSMAHLSAYGQAAGIPVIFGGSHVTFMAHEALKHADYVIRREGHVGEGTR